MLNNTLVDTAEVINLDRFFKARKPATFKFGKPKDEIDSAIQSFLTGATEGKFGRYYIHNDLLVYKVAVTDEVRIGMRDADDTAEYLRFVSDVKAGKYELLNCTLENIKSQYSVKYRVTKANIVAQRIDAATYVGNSSVLSLIGRTVSFGNEQLNRGETEVQRRLSTLLPMIPFNVFKEAELDLAKFKMIDKGQAETVTRSVSTGKYNKKTDKLIMRDETVHFTGASLFEVDGTQFLFDIDRNEIAHKIFNAFLVKLPVKVKTIAEAYQSLKPAEVLAAEKKGLNVLRQGEWFLIPQKGNYEPDMIKQEWGDNKGKMVPKAAELRAGDNRPNNAELSHEFKSGVMLISGLLTHSGREHAPLKLKGWYLPVANTATQSFTIVGDVD